MQGPHSSLQLGLLLGPGWLVERCCLPGRAGTLPSTVMAQCTLVQLQSCKQYIRQQGKSVEGPNRSNSKVLLEKAFEHAVPLRYLKGAFDQNCERMSSIYFVIC